MTGEEIKERITELNRKIRENQEVVQFVLNLETSGLIKEIEALQAQCQHSYVAGICAYCGHEEEKIEE